MKYQLDHKPTLRYFNTVFHQAKISIYDNALEIGSQWGISTIAILEASKFGHLTSVDKDPCPLAENEVTKARLHGRWTFIQKPSQRALPLMKDTFLYDFIFVDGSHVYDECKQDIFDAWELLDPEGVILIDDYLHPKNKDGEYGVMKAANDLIKTEATKHRVINNMIKIQKL